MKKERKILQSEREKQRTVKYGGWRAAGEVVTLAFFFGAAAVAIAIFGDFWNARGKIGERWIRIIIYEMIEITYYYFYKFKYWEIVTANKFSISNFH